MFRAGPADREKGGARPIVVWLSVVRSRRSLQAVRLELLSTILLIKPGEGSSEKGSSQRSLARLDWKAPNPLGAVGYRVA